MLDVQKFEISTVYPLSETNMHHNAKFHQNQSNGRGDMAIYRFSKWRPFAILDF